MVNRYGRARDKIFIPIQLAQRCPSFEWRIRDGEKQYWVYELPTKFARQILLPCINA
jgi:hypothetical protein